VGERFISVLGQINDTETPLVREGCPSFLGVPVARTKEELKGADAAIIGIPYERPATPGRPPGQWTGYRHGPEHARKFSLRYAGYLPELDVDVFEHARLVDYGDAEVWGVDVNQAVENVARKVGEALEAGCRPITLGGFSPCATYAAIKGFSQATDGRVGVVSLDAHGDCLDREFGPRGSREPSSATWQARMWDHFQNIDSTRHVEIGMRGPRNIKEVVETYRRRGVRYHPTRSVHMMGLDRLCREELPRAFADVDRTWLHLDMDVLDIGAVPDWGDEPMGLSVFEVVRIVHEAAKAGVGGLSFVQIAPNSHAIGTVVSYIIVYLLAGWIEGGHIARRG